MRLRRVLLLLIACLPAAPCAWADDGQKRVLVVYSTRRDTQLPTVGDREMPELLAQGLAIKPDYYSEHVDAARFPEKRYREAFADYLRLKYAGTRFDVVVAMHRTAYDMVESVRDDIFPRTPVVFLAQDSTYHRIPNSAGVVAQPDYRRTIALATAMQPDTTQVFVVTGSSVRDVALERVARAQLGSWKSTLTFTYLTGASTAELERTLATLPEHAIVFYVIFYQDGDGVNVTPLDYLSRLTAISNRPVYSWTDSTLDHGVVGGALMSLEGQIGAAATLARRVLRGDSPDAIPVEALDLQTNQVDWRQMQRWGLSDARVPAGTVVRFREPSLWERDKTFILGAAAVVAVETALVVLLVAQGVRRRRAEARAREATAGLRASYERIRDLGGRLLGAQEAERARIARELHDDISQQLTLLVLDLDFLATAHGDGDGDGTLARVSREALERAAGLASGVHQLSHRLHPAKLRLIGLVAALTSLQRETPPGGATVTFTHEHVPPRLPQEPMLCLYRIAQEALQNALKHSSARAIEMRLAGTAGGLTLTVTDDGAGFDVKSTEGRGLGLISMRERLEAVGGTLRIDSVEGRGTRVEAVVPAIGASDVTAGHAETA
jgi:signal transduction histidine kinase